MITSQDKARGLLRYALLVAFIVAWVGAFVATHLPPEGVPEIHASDKVAHCIGYGVLAALLVGTLTSFGKARSTRIATVLVVLLVYGAFDEMTQPIFRRSASFLDWLADAAGVCVVVVAWEIVLALRSALRSDGSA